MIRELQTAGILPDSNGSEEYQRRACRLPIMKTTRALFPLTQALGCGALMALAQEAAPQALLASAEPTVFREVTAKLDAGGSLYAYLSTDQFLGNLSEKVGALREFVLSLPDLGVEERQRVDHAFAAIQNLARRSGVEGVSGIGFSGIALEKGFYRTRVVAQRAAGAEGYLWQWFGTKPHPLAALDILPADTAWAGFGDLDLKAVWDAFLRLADDAQLAPLAEGLRELSSNIRQASGRSLEEHLSSYGGELGIALTLDARRKFSFEADGLELQDLPEPALLIALKVRDDTLYDWLDAAISQNPQSTSGRTDTARWRSLNVPAPVPFAVRPTVARVGEYLLVALNDQLIERADQVRSGKQPGLKSSAEWQRLAKGLPAEGNSFSFVSARFGETLLQVQQAVLRQAAAQSGGPVPDFAGLQKVFGWSTTAASYAVGWTDATGSQVVSQGTQEPAAVLVSSAVVAPTAVMAGMLLPALSKARERAQQINCMNHLKQIALGMHIYANDHDDTLPNDFAALKPYLGDDARILVCPLDTAKQGLRLSWDDVAAGRTSYEFLKPGLKMADESNPAQTVIVRCRLHPQAAFLDGHVEREAR